MKDFTISDVLTDELNIMAKNIMGQMGIDDAVEAVRRINSGEWVVSERKRCTIDKDGIIYIDLPVTTGVTGSQWSDMFSASKLADKFLNSDDFWVTIGTKYRIAIIPREFFSDKNCNITNIRKEMDRRSWLHGNKISPEIACLLKKYLSNQDTVDLDLGYLIMMHEPFKNFDGDSYLLSMMSRGNDNILFDEHTHGRWLEDDGFACVVSQNTQD